MYVEFEGKEGALEYLSQAGTQNLANKGALEYLVAEFRERW